MHNVLILLATFNGETFLEEQLESILSQEKCATRIQVIDNGSKDKTLEILKKFVDLGKIDKIGNFEKLGAAGVFFELLTQVKTGPYVAFADQDDIWDPNKLNRLIEYCDSNLPTMCFSRRRYIDEHGQLIGRSKEIKEPLSWKNAAIQNVAPGNSVLLNSEAVKLLQLFGKVNVNHFDSWVYLVLTMFGRIHYVEDELLSYRLHAGNAVGLRNSADYKKILAGMREYITQIQTLVEILSEHTELVAPQEFLEFAKLISSRNVFKRIHGALWGPIYRQSKAETYLFKFGLMLILIIRK